MTDLFVIYPLPPPPDPKCCDGAGLYVDDTNLTRDTHPNALTGAGLYVDHASHCVCVCVCLSVCLSVIISLCSGLFLCTAMQYIGFVGVLFSA